MNGWKGEYVDGRKGGGGICGWMSERDGDCLLSPLSGRPLEELSQRAYGPAMDKLEMIVKVIVFLFSLVFS